MGDDGFLKDPPFKSMFGGLPLEVSLHLVLTNGNPEISEYEAGRLSQTFCDLGRFEDLHLAFKHIEQYSIRSSEVLWSGKNILRPKSMPPRVKFYRNFLKIVFRFCLYSTQP